MQKAYEVILGIWRDERGLSTIETIIGVLILGGAAAMVGYGLSAGYRGLAGSIVRTIESADPNAAGP